MNTKSFLSSLSALFLIVSSASAAFDLGTPASSTPYEPYSGPVKMVLGGLNGKADMAKVHRGTVKFLYLVPGATRKGNRRDA